MREREYVVYKDINISQPIPDTETVVLFTLQVPVRSKAVITDFGNYVSVFDSWGNIIWRFRNNGILIFPYHEIRDQLGYSAQLRSLAGVVISGGDVFTIEAENQHGAEVGVGIALKWEIHEGGE